MQKVNKIVRLSKTQCKNIKHIHKKQKRKTYLQIYEPFIKGESFPCHYPNFISIQKNQSINKCFQMSVFLFSTKQDVTSSPPIIAHAASRCKNLLNWSCHNGPSGAICPVNLEAVVIWFQDRHWLKPNSSSCWNKGEGAGDPMDHVLLDSCSLLSLTEEDCADLMGSSESPRYK